MRCSLVIIIWMLFSGLCTDAGLICDEPSFDFGEKEEGCIVTHTFIVRNTADTAVIIDRVQTTCGCTAATTSANVVGAGKSIEIQAKLNLEKRTGKQEKKIYIYARDVEKRLELTITGTSIETIIIKPRFLYFGRVEPGHEAVKTVSIRGLKRSLNPGVIQCDSEYVFCTLERGAQENEVILTGVLTGNAPAGEVRGTVCLPIYDGSEILKLPIYASIPSSLFISPSSIKIQPRDADKKLRRIITVRPGVIKKFTLLSVDCPDKSAIVKITTIDAGGYAVALDELTPRAIDGQSIIIRTDAHGAEKISIPCEIVDLSES